jgi:hypothetical protein
MDFRFGIAWVSALVVFSGRTYAQTYTCRAATDSALIVIRNYVVELVTATDTGTVADRVFYDLPTTTANRVTVIGTGRVCSQAGAAYHRAVRPAGTPAISRTLIVLKIGTTRYVVCDMDEVRGEFTPTVVFDKNWVEIKGWES